MQPTPMHTWAVLVGPKGLFKKREEEEEKEEEVGEGYGGRRVSSSC